MKRIPVSKAVEAIVASAAPCADNKAIAQVGTISANFEAVAKSGRPLLIIAEAKV